MSLAHVEHAVADILLVLSGAFAVIGAWSTLFMRDDYQRLHYLALTALVAPILLGVAIAVAQPSPSVIKPLATALLLAAANAVLTHATARACRVRAVGDWSHILLHVPGTERGMPTLPRAPEADAPRPPAS